GVLLGLPDGMITAVVGGPASGKSTLARVIGRQCRADGGTVLTSGGVLPRVGMLTAAPDLIMHRTVLGNVSLPLERAGADRARRMKITARLLDLVGLPDRAACLPDRLSPGERARV